MRQGQPVVAQGGNTGLVGGGVPLDGEITLSLSRLCDVEVDHARQVVTAGAGATIASVQAAARAAGLDYAVDLASRDSATVGGTIATNAGGLRVIRYGDTRAQIAGVDAVRADGSVMSSIRQTERDNTGYDVGRLLCGSEGTLGVITKACLRLRRLPQNRVTALLAFDRVDDAVAASGTLRRDLPAIESIELMLRAGVELVCDVGQLPRPFQPMPEALVLVVVADDDPLEDVLAVVGALQGVADSAIESGAGARRLAAYRERHTEAINTLGPPHKFDIAVAPAKTGTLVREASAAVGELRREARVWLFGHAGEGSVHVNITGLDPNDDDADERIVSLVASLGGSVSAEHGIGTAKSRWLKMFRPADELAAQAAIRSALDPTGILNPRVLRPG
jgi:FAD/FMN-containing dehydrogenase